MQFGYDKFLNNQRLLNVLRRICANMQRTSIMSVLFPLLMEEGFEGWLSRVMLLLSNAPGSLPAAGRQRAQSRFSASTFIFNPEEAVNFSPWESISVTHTNNPVHLWTICSALTVSWRAAVTALSRRLLGTSNSQAKADCTDTMGGISHKGVIHNTHGLDKTCKISPSTKLFNPRLNSPDCHEASQQGVPISLYARPVPQICH